MPSNDITFCVNKKCPRECRRKQIPLDNCRISCQDFATDYKGTPIDFDKCEYFMDGE